ncbi:hypothetical protein GGTG_02468 [Gaeumannomyces tritici R3-111a-1]|uniref:Uncharacterized protein n=1 Tax=Gaeumannomyces tritici (strain R3-111a-1) TaxID=644352 RepID=J3NMG4_GAET3|nr:hypothetical protein GGTG_02468 [Gaeumannomyces tritici R3-111a-1]EJT82495.1 hypothetical protein GGTG_02468 [Gaeumannomyces tritici R3-111a-1]
MHNHITSTGTGLWVPRSDDIAILASASRKSVEMSGEAAKETANAQGEWSLLPRSESPEGHCMQERLVLAEAVFMEG